MICRFSQARFIRNGWVAQVTQYFQIERMQGAKSPTSTTTLTNTSVFSKFKSRKEEQSIIQSEFTNQRKVSSSTSTTRRHSLLYRLFHHSHDEITHSNYTQIISCNSSNMNNNINKNKDNTEEDKSNKNSNSKTTAFHSNNSNHNSSTKSSTILISDSDSDSCSSKPVDQQQQQQLEPSLHDSASTQEFSSLPPPLLMSTLILTDILKQPHQEQQEQLPTAQRKSSSSLANFFKKEVLKKDKKLEPTTFIFSHLKTNEDKSAATMILISPTLSPIHPDSISSVMNSTSLVIQDPLIVTLSITHDKTPHLGPIQKLFDNTKRNNSEASLCEKYGWVEKKCIGKGANGVVRVAHKDDGPLNCEKLYAIKEFKKKHKDESDKSFIKKLTSEFCIGSSLHHVNVIQTIDLIKNDNQQWCEVLEYCGGGDLCNVIQNKHLTPNEVDTFFLQLIHGVDYIHKMGVSHRDLKPENLVLDNKGCLKIADFGEAEVFRNPYEKTSHKSKRCCGSQPYMAPEEFTQKEFDSAPIDIFACGVIYLAMTYNRLPWRKPNLEDSNFRFYLSHLKSGFAFLDRLSPGPRTLLRHILHPDPELRATMDDILGNAWFQGIELAYSLLQESK